MPRDALLRSRFPTHRARPMTRPFTRIALLIGISAGLYLSLFDPTPHGRECRISAPPDGAYMRRALSVAMGSGSSRKPAICWPALRCEKRQAAGTAHFQYVGSRSFLVDGRAIFSRVLFAAPHSAAIRRIFAGRWQRREFKHFATAIDMGPVARRASASVAIQSGYPDRSTTPHAPQQISTASHSKAISSCFVACARPFATSSNFTFPCSPGTSAKPGCPARTRRAHRTLRQG